MKAFLFRQSQMKTLWANAIVAAICWKSSAAQLGDGSLIVLWNYPDSELSTNLTFRVYTSTNIATPLTNWTVLTNTVGTNLSVDIKVIPGQHFFAVSVSNIWGEILFSDTAATPFVPRSDSKISIKRGDL